MGDVAVKAARACGYRGAGTIEMLLAEDGNFYFMEMNTRLQVEHPVTELVHGVDLVAWQLAVAEGRPLPLGQAEIDAHRRGAAIECRVYAEDPLRFLPSPGTITSLRTPSGPYVRDDSGVVAGSAISVYYDPMISKLLTWGDTRDEALGRMRRALDEYRVGGIKTNLPFHRRLLRHPKFIAGEYDTGFIDREKATLLAPYAATDAELETALIAAAIHTATAQPARPPSEGTSAAGASAWRYGRSPWRA
jgi:acetyl-CoA carboxylase biotin carboxylase subunit